MPPRRRRVIATNTAFGGQSAIDASRTRAASGGLDGAARVDARERRSDVARSGGDAAAFRARPQENYDALAGGLAAARTMDASGATDAGTTLRRRRR